MLKKPVFVTIAVTLYLVIYTLLFQLGASFNLLGILFMLSPFLVIWMVYTVLRFGKFEGKELDEDEWGYCDRSRESLGVF